MVEKTPDNQGNGKKSAEESKKVELLPLNHDQQKEAEIEISTTGHEEETKDVTEEEYVHKGKTKADLADQSKSNIPIYPQKEDVQELLEVNLKKLQIPKQFAEKLRNGMSQGDKEFQEAFDEVIDEMKAKKNKELREKIYELEDIRPLFSPHNFWDSQPVPKPSDELNTPESEYDKVIKVQTLEEIRKEPYNLPEGFYWADLEMSDDKQCDELYRLLTQNYVEDDDAMFRFDYKVPFLRWALTPPGYHKNWMLAVRGANKHNLLAFIAGIPVDVNVNGKQVKMCEINYLCVHKKLRAKKLAPVLIKEITRRVNITGVWSAIYTAGATIPTPFGHATYWHRNINCKKLIDVRFSCLKAGVPLSRHIRIHKLNSDPELPGIRMMKEHDIEQVRDLLNQDLKKNTKIHFHWSNEEVVHFLLPQKDVIYSYVVEDGSPQRKITDFFSFYSLPSSILKPNQGDHKTLNAAYSYYNVSTTNRMKQGIADMLIFAEHEGFDVFNCLDLNQNDTEILKELLFGVGDGRLHYYLYNWRVHKLEPTDIGIVLV